MVERHNEYLKIVSMMFLAITGIIIALYLFDLFNVPTSYGWVGQEYSREWLSILASYFGVVAGAFVGFVGTLMAVNISNEKQEDIRKEDRRKEALPLVAVSASDGCRKDVCVSITHIIDGKKRVGESDDRWFSGRVFFQIKNVGVRELYNLDIVPRRSDFFSGSSEKSKKVPVLYVDSSIGIAISLFVGGVDKTPPEIELGLLGGGASETAKMYARFEDCCGNKYR